MNDVLDYLRWRGDLSFTQSAFNAVDGVILSRFSYLPFEHVLQADGTLRCTVAKAAEGFLRNPELSLSQEDRQLLSILKESVRFGLLHLCLYLKETDPETQTQFAAVAVRIGEAESCLCFRGTDNTLVGWKEDFNMTFVCPVPAQTLAVTYLTQYAALVPGKLLLCGHSKGGNLAVYAAAFCPQEVQARVQAIYNYDGPGFNEQILSADGYQAVCSKVHTFVPQSSIVGMMLGHEEQYAIVHSSQKGGIWQHDVYTWEVLQTAFVCLETVTNSSRFIDFTLKTWLSDMSPAQRETFVDTVYSVMRQTNATTMRELTDNWFANAKVVTQAMKGLDETTRKAVTHALGLLLKSTKAGFFRMMQTRS